MLDEKDYDDVRVFIEGILKEIDKNPKLDDYEVHILILPSRKSRKGGESMYG